MYSIRVLYVVYMFSHIPSVIIPCLVQFIVRLSTGHISQREKKKKRFFSVYIMFIPYLFFPYSEHFLPVCIEKRVNTLMAPQFTVCECVPLYVWIKGMRCSRKRYGDNRP